MRCASLNPIHDFTNFAQTRPEHWMPEIRPRLIERLNRILLAHRAETEPRDLRKDKPNPMSRLPSAPKLRTCLLKHTALRLNKPLQIVRITIACHSSYPILTSPQQLTEPVHQSAKPGRLLHPLAPDESRSAR